MQLHQCVNWKELLAGRVETGRSVFYALQSDSDEFIFVPATMQRAAVFPLVLRGRDSPSLHGSALTWKFIERDMGLGQSEVQSLLLFGLIGLSSKLKTDEGANVGEILSEALPFDVEFSEDTNDLEPFSRLGAPAWMMRVATRHQLGVKEIDMKGLVTALLPTPLEVSTRSDWGYDTRSEVLLLAHGVDWSTMDFLRERNIGVWYRR